MTAKTRAELNALADSRVPSGVAGGVTADNERQMFKDIIDSAELTTRTPYDFGAVGDGVTDDTAALNAFFAAVADDPRGFAACCGTFFVTSKIYIGSETYDGIGTTKAIFFAAYFISGFASDDEIVQVRNCGILSLIGEVWIAGKGGNVYSARENMDGVLFEGVNTFSNSMSFYIRYVKRWGAVVGNYSNMLSCPRIDGQYCGSSRTGNQLVQSTFSSTNQLGSANSQSTQKTELSLDGAVPDALDIYGSCFIDGLHYGVTAIDRVNNVVTVYPWLPNATTSWTITWVIGGSVLTYNSNANAQFWHLLSGRQCGYVWRSASSNPGRVGVIHADASQVAFGLGVAPLQSSVGGSIGEFYVEGCDLQVVQYSGAASSFAIQNASGAVDHSAWLRLRPNDGAGNDAPYGMDILTIHEGHVHAPLGPSDNPTTSFTAETDPNGSPSFYARYTNTCTVTLEESADVDRLWGGNSIFVMAVGTGANRQPTGTWTFEPEAGYTVNGGASAAFSGMTGPTLFLAYLVIATKDWKVEPFGAPLANPVAIAADTTPPTLAFGKGLYVVSNTTDANDLVNLPAGTANDIGKPIRLYASEAFELRAASASATLNGVVIGATNECAIPQGMRLTVEYVDTDTWLAVMAVAADGTPTQLVPHPR